MVTIIHFLDYADLVGEFRRFSLKSSNTFKIIGQESGTTINFHGEANFPPTKSLQEHPI